MADLSVTAANVATVSGGVCKDFVAGEAIAAGQCVYLKSSNNKWMLAQADGTAEEVGGTPAAPTRFGIAVSTGVLNQFMAVQETGIITMGATVTVGKIYVVSAAAGGVAPVADITVSTHKLTVLGIGASASTIDMAMKSATGYAIP